MRSHNMQYIFVSVFPVFTSWQYSLTIQSELCSFVSVLITGMATNITNKVFSIDDNQVFRCDLFETKVFRRLIEVSLNAENCILLHVMSMKVDVAGKRLNKMYVL